MKRFFFFLLLLHTLPLLAGTLNRPLEIIVNFPPPYPTQASYYFDNPDAYSITVINHTDADQEVYFVAELRGLMNGVLVTTVEGYRSGLSVLVPGRGTLELTGDDIANVNEGLTLADLVTVGIPLDELNLNGNLPEGMYEFCIKAYDFNLPEDRPLSTGCGTLIDIYYGDQITILSPQEGDIVLDNEYNPTSTFNMLWDPNIADPTKLNQLEYEVRLIDITEAEEGGFALDLEYDTRGGGIQGIFDQTLLPLTESSYFYNGLGTDLELEWGHQYVMRVRVLDPFDEVLFSNDGWSEIRTFWYGEIPSPDDESGTEISECVANCNFTDPIADVPTANAHAFTELAIGNFTLTEVEYTSPPGASAHTGTGTIVMDWLNNFPLAVAFTGIQINEAGRVFNGEVRAADHVPDDNLSLLGDVDWRLGLAESLLTGGLVPENQITDFYNQLMNNRMVEFLLSDNPQGLPLGFSREIQGHHFNFGITQAVFRPTDADFDVVAFVDMTSLHPNFLIPLAARQVCVGPNGPGAEWTLELTQDLPKTSFGNMEFVLEGADVSGVNNGSCYLKMDCDGLREAAIHGTVTFSRDLLIPDDGGEALPQGEVMGYFGFTLDRNVPIEQSEYAYRGEEAFGAAAGNHLMLGFDMDPFQVRGLDGWSFLVQQATLDLSDLANPDSIAFSQEYIDDAGTDTSAIWQGFHLQNLTVLTPPEMTKAGRRSFQLRDVLIDEAPTLSLYAEALNLVSVETGDMGGWGFSLDTFQLNIARNVLIDGRMIGAVSTPLVGSADYLDYRAVINRNEDEQLEFNAIAVPRDVVEIPLAIADAALCPNSFIHFETAGGETQLTAFLAGQMSMNVARNLPAELQQQNLVPDVSVRLAEFQLHFNSEDGFIDDGPAPSNFTFGIQIETETCGFAYPEEIFEDTDAPDYAYDISEMGDILASGIEPDAGAPADTDVESNQETLSGFPIGIGDVGFAFAGNDLTLSVEITLELGGDGERAMAGSATVGIESTLNLEANGLKKIKLTGISLECVRVGSDDEPLDLDFMTVWGEVCMVEFNEGKGFTGEIHLTVGSNMTLDLEAGFGKSGTRDAGDFGTPEYFAWYYLDGMFRMDPGISVGPVTFNGVGGAIYWNYPAPNLTLDVSDVMAMADGGAPMPPKDDNIVPIFGDRSLAFRMSLSLVSTQTVVVDPEIAVRWVAGDGLQQITINGAFWIMATDYFDREETSRLWGNTSTGITFERGRDGKKKVAVVGTNSIYANIIPDVLFGAGPDKLLVSSAFAIGSEELFDGYGIDHSDKDSTYWFLNVGNPYEGNMGGIKFELPGFNMDKADNDGDALTDNGQGLGGAGGGGGSGGLSVQFYMMTGQAVPLELPEPPGLIYDMFQTIEDHQNGGNSFAGDGLETERQGDGAQMETGAGIVMGAHVMASAEVNALIYANFAILSGMDMMLVRDNTPESCLTRQGKYVEEKGVQGWYGTGRAYIGLQGALGVRGKILGSEVDAKIMDLVAAVMVEAGGPRPMYLDGRAGVYFNILNGFIEGSALMQIQVGDKCLPAEGTPFGFEVIVDSSPDETANDDEPLSPFIDPAAAFSIRLAEDPDNPVPNDYVQVINVEGDPVRRLGYIHEFSITPVGGGARANYERDGSKDMLINEGRAARYVPVTSISGTLEEEMITRWRYRLVIRGKQQTEEGDWVPIPGENGNQWEEVRDFEFTTGPLPEALPHSEIGITKPLRYQHYYLQDEVGGHQAFVRTRADWSEEYFDDEDENGNPYTYHALVLNPETGEEYADVNASWNQSSRQVSMTFPQLPNATEFTVYLIKKLNGRAGTILISRDQIIASGSSQNEELGVSEEYEVEAPVADLSDMVNLGSFETKIYEWTFRTSAHNTLTQKLAGLELRADPFGNGFQNVHVEGTYEGFDRYEIKGKLHVFGTNLNEEDPYFQTAPLIEMADPFNSSFHNTLSKPKIGGFVGLYQDEYADERNGLRYLMNTQHLPGGGEEEVVTSTASGPSGCPGYTTTGMPPTSCTKHSMMKFRLTN